MTVTNVPARGVTKAASMRGRRRDHSLDAIIMNAAIEVLADVGFSGMTMDMIASRAKTGKATVYRRWKSKPQMVVDAVAHLKRTQVDLESLPDTGTLRGDLLALLKPSSTEERERNLRVMAGLASVLTQHPELAEAANAAIVAPWAEANRLLMQRALDRGEISATADIETVAQVIPSMAACRALIQRRPFDCTFLTKMVDSLLLPALRNGAQAANGRDRSD